jgi:hypothetical protein
MGESIPNKRKMKNIFLYSVKLEVMLPKYQAALERTLRYILRQKLQNKTHISLSRTIVMKRKFHDCYLSTKTTDYTADTNTYRSVTRRNGILKNKI